jgi:hypothetical protein
MPCEASVGRSDLGLFANPSPSGVSTVRQSHGILLRLPELIAEGAKAGRQSRGAASVARVFGATHRLGFPATGRVFLWTTGCRTR